MSKTVGIDGLAEALTETLNEYQENVTMGMKDLVKKTAKLGVDAIRQSAPVRTGEYAKGWTSKMEEGRLASKATIHNKTRYQLAHLLEKGHEIGNGHGYFGRTKAIPHLKPVEDEIVKQMQDGVVKVVK